MERGLPCYSVTVTIKGGNEGIKNLNIYSGRRNIAKRDISIDPDREFKCRYRVHIGDFIPVMGKQTYYDKMLEFHGSIKHMTNTSVFENLLSNCYDTEWGVYCKKPFRNAECVVEYLGRYTHRVAISKNRVTKLEVDIVAKKWKV